MLSEEVMETPGFRGGVDKRKGEITRTPRSVRRKSGTLGFPD